MSLGKVPADILPAARNLDYTERIKCVPAIAECRFHFSPCLSPGSAIISYFINLGKPT